MSLGPVMVDLAGLELQPEEREVLHHPLVGGVLLFSRNFAAPEQVRALVDDIHATREPRLVVAVDQEGGRVQRFREGFTRLPPVRRLGELYDRDPARARAFAEITAWLMACELRAVGVDISFAPVLDLDRGVSTVIGDRAFHSDPEAAADLAHAYMKGMRQADMAATGKHFPGHGSVSADSHLELPVDPRPYADIAAEDLLVFERLIHFGIAGLMMAHVVYSDFDPAPAGFSQRWVKGVLREQLQFSGVVFSDDLNMAAADQAGDFLARAEAALDAGCDMLPVCNNVGGRNRILDGLQRAPDPVSHLRLVRLHARHRTEWPALRKDPRWQQARVQIEEYDPAPRLDMDL